MTTTSSPAATGTAAPLRLALPDTLNLAQRAELAIHALDALRDERLGGQLYFYIRLYEQPPTGYHAAWDYGDGTGRHIDALTLTHLMTGSRRALQVAHELADLLLTWQGEKGLLWWPAEIWNEPGPAGTALWRFVRDPKPAPPVAELAWSPRGALMGLTTLYQHTGDERLRRSAQQLVAGLDEVALTRDDYRYLPELVYSRDGWRHRDEGRSDGTSELRNGPIIHPLLRYFRATGDDRALKLAEGLLRFIISRAEGYEPDGRFYKTTGHWNHFHSKSEVITSAILCGVIAGKPEFIAWGRQAYDAARRWGTDFGWFPEDLCIHQCCETCCITDMLESAILLGLHVDARYFNDVERYGRNHLVESQFLDTRWMARIPRVPAEQDAVHVPPRRVCSRDMAQRSVGSFAGFSAPNDLFGEPSDPKWKNVRIKIMQCCNGAGARALYDLWHYAADDDGRRARVHMHFSRATPWADIVSHSPYAGRLDVHMKAARTLALRVPQWAPTSLRVEVNGHEVAAKRDGEYVVLEQLDARDVVSLKYVLPLSASTYTLGPDQYVALFKGDTVISITPQGKYCPLYQRDHLLANAAPTVQQLWHCPVRELDSI